MHLNVTASPTAAWVWRQLIEATPWGRAPRYLVRDRDAVYRHDFVPRANGLGINTVPTPVRAARANAVAERLVGTLRRECLDHLVIVNEAHLRAVLAEFAGYYNRERPHRALDLQTPEPSDRPRAGPIHAKPVLGGLHHLRACGLTPPVSGPDSLLAQLLGRRSPRRRFIARARYWTSQARA